MSGYGIFTVRTCDGCGTELATVTAADLGPVGEGGRFVGLKPGSTVIVKEDGRELPLVLENAGGFTCPSCNVVSVFRSDSDASLS